MSKKSESESQSPGTEAAPRYEHTQHGYWQWIISGLLVITVLWQWNGGDWIEPLMPLVLFIGTMILLMLSFSWLRVADGGNHLLMHFGPLPLATKRIPYTRITSVKCGRMSLFDGWGIHWFPGHGWTWAVHGFECAVLHLGDRRLQIGTDDSAGLAAFLEERIAEHR